MANLDLVKPHAEVIGADGVRVGEVESVSGLKLKLVQTGAFGPSERYIDAGLIADVEPDGAVRLSANAEVAVSLEEIEADKAADSERLDEGLEETFPASDSVSAKHIT